MKTIPCPLDPDEWNFSKIPKNQKNSCFVYEYARHIGGDPASIHFALCLFSEEKLSQTPFLKLTPPEKSDLLNLVKTAKTGSALKITQLQSLEREPAEILKSRLYKADNRTPPRRKLLISVDLTLPATVLGEEFTEYVKSLQHQESIKPKQRRPDKPGGSVDAYLRGLGMFRLLTEAKRVLTDPTNKESPSKVSQAAIRRLARKWGEGDFARGGKSGRAPDSVYNSRKKEDKGDETWEHSAKTVAAGVETLEEW